MIKIPEKTYFKIGEVSKLMDLESYVLRYWETEFPSLKPEKTKTGQRSYRRQDIELLNVIKFLLYDEEYTIAGARKKLKKMKKDGEVKPLQHVVEELKAETDILRRELEPLKIALAPLQKRNATLERENRAVKAAYAELEKTKDALIAQHQAQQSFSNETEEVQNKLVEAENKLIESRRVVGRQATENLRLKNDNKALEQDLEEAQFTFASLNQKIELLEANQQDTEALRSLEERLDASLKTIATLKTDQSDILRKTSARRQKATRGFLNLRRELETLLEAVN